MRDEKDTNRGRDLPTGPVFQSLPDSGHGPDREIQLTYAQHKALRALEPFLRTAPENTLFDVPTVTDDKRKAKLAQLIQDALGLGVPRSRIARSLFEQAGLSE